MRLLLVLLTFLVAGSCQKGESKHWNRGTSHNQSSLKSDDKASDTRANGQTVAAQDICAGDITLDYGEAVTIFSDSEQDRKCKTKILTPAGTEIGFTCFSFNLDIVGCGGEFLKLKASENGGNTKYKFCTTDAPSDLVIANNELTLKHKRKIKTGSCSGGFVCEAYTIGDQPSVQ